MVDCSALWVRRMLCSAVDVRLITKSVCVGADGSSDGKVVDGNGAGTVTSA